MTSRATMAMVMGRMRCRAEAPADGQDDQDGLGSVGHRGERVEGEGRKTFDGRDLLARGLFARQRPADEAATDRPESVHRPGPRRGHGSSHWTCTLRGGARQTQHERPRSRRLRFQTHGGAITHRSVTPPVSLWPAPAQACWFSGHLPDGLAAGTDVIGSAGEIAVALVAASATTTKPPGTKDGSNGPPHAPTPLSTSGNGP